MRKHKELKQISVLYTDQLRGDWIGDWQEDGVIRIFDGLNSFDRSVVFVHEFIEMIISFLLNIPECCDKTYSTKKHGFKNAAAHNIATAVEAIVVSAAGESWKAYQDRVTQVRLKRYGKDWDVPCESCYKKDTCEAREI